MAKAAHSMIRVVDEDRSVGFYREAFGFEVADRVDFDDFSLVYLKTPESEFELELTANRDRREAYDHGSAYGHLAVTVDDLAGEHARLEGSGLEPEPLKTLSREEFAASYFFVTDPDGYRIEVIERGGRFH